MLLAAAGEGVISTLVKALPQRFTHSDRIQSFATEKSQMMIAEGKSDLANLLTLLGFDNVEIKSVDETDGLRITLSDQRIVHLRPSGNAPELRCYVEADSYENSKDCVERSLRYVQSL
ncbi:phosphomannomutase [Moritella sp. PE36]|uniref:phosphomannomutase n=1 Tax=Moritella sp. PE36 TaxID=58051 RepID=UPI00015681BA|nr:phosphomannomutase [Moritella sp. PE36]EDM69040.1 phosphomannomutase [Moritella sp. PE36]